VQRRRPLLCVQRVEVTVGVYVGRETGVYLPGSGS